MKKVNQATLLLISLIGLTACGSGGSDNKSNIANQTSSQAQDASVTITGSVEKGPFVIGSSVTINILNEKGENTDSTIVTKTTDDLGNFEFKVPADSIIQITASGFYRNEITGGLSEGQLTLRSIYKASSEQQQNANVNLLTHITSNRVLELIKAGESDFNAAIKKAEEEFSANFKSVITHPKEESFSNLSIYKGDNAEANAYFLTLSSMLYQHAIDTADTDKTSPEAALTAILNELENDFGTDGKVDDTARLTAIQQTQRYIDPTSVLQNIMAWLDGHTGYEVPDINEFLDSDLDGLVNNQDEDDDNDGIVDKDDSNQFITDFTVNDQTLSVAEDSAIEIAIESNAPLGENIPISFDLLSDVTSGILILDYPNITYIPNNDFNGTDEFEFKLSQKQVESQTVRVSLDVTPVNDAPTLSGSPSTEIYADEEYVFQPTSFDADQDNLTFSVKNLPEWLSLDPVTGEIKGTAGNLNTGIYSDVTLSVTDGTASTVLPTFTINVNYSLLDAPTNYQQKSTSKNLLQEIELSWDKVEFAQSYLLEVSLFEDFNTILTSETLDSNSITLQKEPNVYFWRVSTINPDGTQGFSGEVQRLDAGVFSVTMGGSNDERVQDIMPAQGGGYIILASTNSHELSSEIGPRGSDWLIKLDEQGKVVWEYFTAAYSFERIFELEDGSIIAAGHPVTSGPGIVTKLDANGQKLWEKTFSTGTENEVHYFGFTLAHNKIYFVSHEVATNEQGIQDTVEWSLRSFDFNTSLVSEPIILPDANGNPVRSSRVLVTSPDNNLMVLGGYSNGARYGTTFTVLDENLQPKVHWYKDSNQTSLGFTVIAAQVNDNNYAIIGQGDDVSFALISPTGETIVDGNLPSEARYTQYGNRSLVQAKDGTFYTVAATTSYHTDTLFGFNQQLEITSTLSLNTEDYGYIYSTRELLMNEDGTVTILIHRTDSNYDNGDFIIKRVKP
ncbi:hypothetical protein N473_21760 [Pseudoalteromonas luteoviolacea CPMOR-1]|uniref:Dystroglycan-type cadherin-like domain-containing protein n=1 Tax=Pseudoalteromonas luteoviolacea CPMOR-1 TaxID=1365248 RepID=A0A167JXQ1_9GAMM|nr:putative Ig domain-containing protein [Pseudoalteromonas luteoviolacea]KZN61817.1 hypothetical protein N473_21760 [Pseudoalteromonas luteoviolacea CPMOR-1]